MLEWYDLRMIDLYPEDDSPEAGLTPPPGVIGEPREEIPANDGGSPEDETALATSGGTPPGRCC